MSGRLLIYGASGFSGKLIAAQAKDFGNEVILAGRTPDRLQSLAESLHLPWRIARLDDPQSLDHVLSDINVVLHAAGPFHKTARPMLQACLRKNIHYLDVTGELTVFQDLHRFDAEARSRGVMVMPGVGFVLLASDCLVAHVAAKLPEAQYLRIGFSRPTYFSRGTLKTMLSLVRERVTIRREGRLATVPVGRLERSFDFGEGQSLSTAVNWADVYTAFYTTGIPNIEVYAEAPILQRSLYQLGAWWAEPMKLPPWKRILELQSSVWPEGPSAETREGATRVIVAEIEDRWRRQVSSRLCTPDGYNFTAVAALAVAQRVLNGEYQPGFHTPASVYGPDFVLLIEGVRREEIVKNSWV